MIALNLRVRLIWIAANNPLSGFTTRRIDRARRAKIRWPESAHIDRQDDINRVISDRTNVSLIVNVWQSPSSDGDSSMKKLHRNFVEALRRRVFGEERFYFGFVVYQMQTLHCRRNSASKRASGAALIDSALSMQSIRGWQSSRPSAKRNEWIWINNADDAKEPIKSGSAHWRTIKRTISSG